MMNRPIKKRVLSISVLSPHGVGLLLIEESLRRPTQINDKSKFFINLWFDQIQLYNIGVSLSMK
jgi:hypothetical protein